MLRLCHVLPCPSLRAECLLLLSVLPLLYTYTCSCTIGRSEVVPEGVPCIGSMHTPRCCICIVYLSSLVVMVIIKVPCYFG